jgi:hypothetical protein
LATGQGVGAREARSVGPTTESSREEADKLDRGELLKLYDQHALEIRACLDLAHRSLAFYVGLLSALLVAVLAGLLRGDAAGIRVLWLLLGPILMIGIAEIGYSMVEVFYHRFMDATLTLLNISRMLRLDDLDWVSSDLAAPLVPSRYGGFIAQWSGLRTWLQENPQADLEGTKEAMLAQSARKLLGTGGRRPRSLRLGTASLTAAHRTMRAFEAGSVALMLAIVAAAF